jgi:hypothetical protein
MNRGRQLLGAVVYTGSGRLGGRGADQRTPPKLARFRGSRWCAALRCGLLAGVLVGFAALGAGGTAPTIDVLSDPATDSGSMQFTHGGHALAFGPTGVIVAGGDHALTVEFVGANPREPQPSTAPSTDGRTQPLDRVTYPDLWDGVSLFWEATSNGIVKTTYRIAPGAGADRIRLRYNVPVAIDVGGSLVFAFAAGALRESAPAAWQEIAGQRIPVEVASRVVSKREVGFTLGEHSPTHPLTIDLTFAWHTFLGGSSNDEGYAIAVDGEGNIYVAGASYASWGSPIADHSGGIHSDAFVAKLHSSGVLLWHTFLGGSSSDCGYAVAVDGDGNVFVAGWSYVSWGSPLNPYSGNGDAFVAVLNASGVLQWNTFLGGSSFDLGRAITVDGDGNVVVAGYSDASWGAPIVDHSGGYDAFVAKLNASGVLQWHTFLGGSSYDAGYAVAVDVGGNVVVAGYSDATWGTPIVDHSGGIGALSDAFAAKLDSSGVLQWNTFMGASDSNDNGYAIAVDGSGSVYVAGESASGTWGAPVNPHSGSWEAFAAKLNASGALVWNTFLGSWESDYGKAIAVDGDGDVYVAGDSFATWGAPVVDHSGGTHSDAFVAVLNASGVLQWNTFLGGSGIDRGNAIAVDGEGNVVVAGESDATWDAPVVPHAGGLDAFVARIRPSPEIRVQGGSLSIEDGDATPSADDGTDFGNAAVRSGNVVHAFAIQNGGLATLTLTGMPPYVEISGDHAGDFSVLVPPVSSIPAEGGVTVFAITFDPSAPGLRTATISIANDDPDENPYDFAIQGTGTICEIDVQGNGASIADGDTTPSADDDTDFGEAVANAQHVEGTFTLCNTGGAELALIGSPCVQISGDHAADFAVTVQPSTPIACDGGTCTFTVRFTPSTPGLRTATISIANDDSDENPYDFAICGTGLEPGTPTAASFRVDASGNVLADGAITATVFESGFADVAEWVTVSEPVEAGDVLEFDPTALTTYRRSGSACSSLVAGVVSTAPGMILGGHGTKDQALLALTGIVPVKVTNEGGPILPGDLLVTSSTPGHAMRWDGVGSPALVGKALEPMTGKRGVILVLLTAH